MDMLKKDFQILFVLTFLSVNLYSEAKQRLKNKDFGPKIVGGKSVPITRYPHAVQFYNLGAFCSGIILNTWSVITAAHCLENNRDIDEMSIQIGSRHIFDIKAKKYKLHYFAVHEDYSKRIPFESDIALLFVTKPIQFSKMAKKAILVDSDKWMNSKEKKFVVTGWGWQQYPGSLSKKDLLMTVLKYVPIEECSRLHNLEFSQDMFCLYGDGHRDSCRGDSGGGVLWHGKLVGITSHGDGCAKKDKPSVYTNVWYHLGWIEKKLSDFVIRYCRRRRKIEAKAKKSKNKIPKCRPV